MRSIIFNYPLLTPSNSGSTSSAKFINTLFSRAYSPPEAYFVEEVTNKGTEFLVQNIVVSELFPIHFHSFNAKWLKNARLWFALILPRHSMDINWSRAAPKAKTGCHKIVVHSMIQSVLATRVEWNIREIISWPLFCKYSVINSCHIMSSEKIRTGASADKLVIGLSI